MSSLRVNDLIFLAKAWHCLENVSVNMGHLAVLAGVDFSEVIYERIMDIDGQLVNEYGEPPKPSTQGRELSAAGEMVDASGGHFKSNVVFHRHAKHASTAARVGADAAGPAAELDGGDAPKAPSCEDVLKRAELRAQLPLLPKEDTAVPEDREQQQARKEGASPVRSIEQAMNGASERTDSGHASDQDHHSDDESPVDAKDMTDGQVLQKQLKMASAASEDDDGGADDEAEASEDEQKEAVSTAHAAAASASAPAMKVPASDVHTQVAQHALQLQDEPADEPKQERAQTPALAAKPAKAPAQRKKATTTKPATPKAAKPKQPGTPAPKPRKPAADHLTSAVPPVTNLSMEPTEPPGSAATKRKRAPPQLNEDGTPKEAQHRKGSNAWLVANPHAAEKWLEEQRVKKAAKQAEKDAEKAGAPRRKTPAKSTATAAAAHAGESDDADVDEKRPKAKKAKAKVQPVARQQPSFEE